MEGVYKALINRDEFMHLSIAGIVTTLVTLDALEEWLITELDVIVLPTYWTGLL